MNELDVLSAIIIDDHPLARMAIRSILESNGIKILAEASDGAEALLFVSRHQPDIVIVDVDMPEIGGIELVKILRKRKYKKIIIVLSAKSELFYGKRSAEVGANAFISKREGMKNIISAINAAKSGYSYFPFLLDSFIGTLSSEQDMIESLSSQEMKVMCMILKGESNKSISSEMNISNKTVSTYKSRLMEKLNCRTLIELYSFGSRNGIK